MPQPVGYPATVAEYRQLIKDFGTCLSFDGSNDEITIGTSNPFSSDFYFSAWVKWYGDTGTYQHIFAKRDSYGGSTMMFDLYLNTSTNLLSLDTNAAQANFNYLLPKYKWVNLVWVHNVTDSLEQIYINGDRVYNSTIKTLGTGTTALNTIGAVEATPTEGFNGKMDEIVIGQSAPTWAEVVAMYAKYNYPSQWTYFKLDEGSGTSTTDSSGNSNTGTISGATYSTDKIMTTRNAVTNRFTILNSSKSLAFGGSASDKATIPVVPSTSGFNVGFWILDRNSGNSSRFISYEYSSAPTNGFNILKNSNQFVFTVLDNASTTVNIASKYNPGKWYFVVATFKTNEAKLYVNASQVGSTDTSCTMGTPTPSQSFGIAYRVDSGFNNANMLIKNLTFQNTTTPWTQQQITDLYWRNIIPSGATQWSMNNVATDQDGGNALTLTGTSYSTNVPGHMTPRTAV